MRCFYREERKVRKLPDLAHFAFFAVSQQKMLETFKTVFTFETSKAKPRYSFTQRK